MRILLTGTSGQVGWELLRTLQALGRVVTVGRDRMDLAQPDSIRRTIREVEPSVIVNPAAYTAVDKAESESDLAMTVNAIAPGIMAEESKRLGATLIHYSTDYVFDGRKTEAYREEDTPNPLSVYGQSKLSGERAIQAVGVSHLIFRTSWVYGMRGRNFLLTILRLAKERPELRVVSDQFGAPTWSRTIAEVTALVLGKCESGDFERWSGTYHLCSSGSVSWFGFARAILEHCDGRGAELRAELRSISTDEYPQAARRPLNSTMSVEKLARVFDLALPHWKDALDLCMDNGYAIKTQ